MHFRQDRKLEKSLAVLLFAMVCLYAIALRGDLRNIWDLLSIPDAAETGSSVAQSLASPSRSALCTGKLISGRDQGVPKLFPTNFPESKWIQFKAAGFDNPDETGFSAILKKFFLKQRSQKVGRTGCVSGLWISFRKKMGRIV